MKQEIYLPQVVLSRDGREQGRPTGGVKHCMMEGCPGVRIAVRWPNGKLTYPCSKGMKEIDPDVWQII